MRPSQAGASPYDVNGCLPGMPSLATGSPSGNGHRPVHLAGPWIKVTAADRVAPLASTYASDRPLPGRKPVVSEMSPRGEVTALPFALVITSPGARPAWLAAVPEYTLQISAPELAADPLKPPSPPGTNPPMPALGQPVAASATEMPM